MRNKWLYTNIDRHEYVFFFPAFVGMSPSFRFRDWPPLSGWTTSPRPCSWSSLSSTRPLVSSPPSFCTWKFRTQAEWPQVTVSAPPICSSIRQGQITSFFFVRYNVIIFSEFVNKHVANFFYITLLKILIIKIISLLIIFEYSFDHIFSCFSYYRHFGN